MIDTDGLTDRCRECGERANIVKLVGGWIVECAECGNCIPFRDSKSAAITQWNIEQRSNDESIENKNREW